MSEREDSNTFKYSKLFVENQQIMEHSELLMFPDSQQQEYLWPDSFHPSFSYFPPSVEMICSETFHLMKMLTVNQHVLNSVQYCPLSAFKVDPSGQISFLFKIS
jgi:hypothetical protein